MKTWSGIIFWGAVLAACLSIAVPSAARTSQSLEEQEIGRCINLAAKGRPWLEKTLWGLRDQEAGWIGAAVPNTNGTVDLGPMQVNSWWAPKLAGVLRRPAAHVRYWLRFDACFNAEAARWIFLSALVQTDSYWKAIGIYHSPTSWRQREYAAAVAAHLSRRYGPRLWK